MRSTGLDKTTGAWDAGCYWVEDDGSVHRRLAGEFEDTSCYASVALLAYANILEAHHINLLAERDALREALANVEKRCWQTNAASRIGRKAASKNLMFVQGQLSEIESDARASLALSDGR